MSARQEIVTFICTSGGLFTSAHPDLDPAVLHVPGGKGAGGLWFGFCDQGKGASGGRAIVPTICCTP